MCWPPWHPKGWTPDSYRPENVSMPATAGGDNSKCYWDCWVDDYDTRSGLSQKVLWSISDVCQRQEMGNEGLWAVCFLVFMKMRQRQPRWLSCVCSNWVGQMYNLNPSNFSYFPIFIYYCLCLLIIPFQGGSFVTPCRRQETISKENPPESNFHPSIHSSSKCSLRTHGFQDPGKKHSDPWPREMCSELRAKNNTMW